jgi:predicted nucleic-acid-binding protein
VIYVDTSVVVRYLTGDDPVRSPAATVVIEVAAPRAISIITILEAAHLLRSEYHHDRSNIASALIDLVSRRNIVVADCDKDHVLRWLEAWRDGAADSIGDALIAASMSATDAEAIITFDRGFPTGPWSVLTGPHAIDPPG